MGLPCVTLVGFLVPVLVIPLGLLALSVLGVTVVAIYTFLEKQRRVITRKEPINEDAVARV